MIQDMFTVDRFRWSLAPDTVYESEDMFSVVWESRPPTECGGCDGIQGAMVTLSKICHYAFKLPECEDKEYDADCEKLLFSFYSKYGKSYQLTEVSYVTLDVLTLSTPLKACRGGGSTSLTTSNSQINFWRSTADQYFKLTAKDFSLKCEKKLVPGTGIKFCPPGFTNIACECIPTGGPSLPPLPGFPDLPVIDFVTFPPRTSVRIGAQGWRVSVDGQYSSFQEIVPGNSSFSAFIENGWGVNFREFNYDYRRPPYDGMSCVGDSESMYQFIDLYGAYAVPAGMKFGHGTAVASASNTVAGYFDTESDGNFRCSRQAGQTQVFLRFYLPDGTIVDVPIQTFRPGDDITGDDKPLPPPPPPPNDCTLWKLETYAALFSKDALEGYEKQTMFTTKFNDEFVCAKDKPLPHSFDHIYFNFLNAGGALDLIGIDTVITKVGTCPCP